MDEFEISEASKKTKRIYISTVFSISLVLLVLGMLGLLLVQAKNLGNYVKENVVLNILIEDGTKEDDILAFQQTLSKDKMVKEIKYIDKVMAAKSLTNDLGEDFVKFLGYNPLLPMLDVNLNAEYATSQSVAVLKESLSKNPIVKEVVFQNSLIDEVNNNIKIITTVILGFAIILLVIAIALINNTIRLAIYSQRFLIKSMQLVGATKGFICKPFLGYACLQGIVSGIISGIILLFILLYTKNRLPEIKVLQTTTDLVKIIFGMLLTGVFITFCSTWFAVNKYLSLRKNNLYR